MVGGRYQKPQLKPHMNMRVASLTVFDETTSCTLLLPDTIAKKQFEQLREGESVLVLRNAATLLDSRSCLYLTLTSAKYSSLQVYNRGS